MDKLKNLIITSEKFLPNLKEKSDGKMIEFVHFLTYSIYDGFYKIKTTL